MVVISDSKLVSLLSATIGMQDFSCAVNLCHLLLRCRDVAGDVVELGCHRGDTAKLLTALTTKRVIVFDSFEGLPEPTAPDQGHQETAFKGAFKATVNALVRNFEKDDLPMPEIVNGWFNKVSEFEMPERIAFAHIDADLFESTVDALMLVYPKLSPGAVCVIHDYGFSGLPGVKRAVDEFLVTKAEFCMVRELPRAPDAVQRQAYFTKL